MNTGNPNDTRLIYDQCSYEEKLKMGKRDKK